MSAETARMWLSLGAFIPHKNNQFCINDVTGPDEYTAIVNNNAFTNLMARENLEISIARSGAEAGEDEKNGSVLQKICIFHLIRKAESTLRMILLWTSLTGILKIHRVQCIPF